MPEQEISGLNAEIGRVFMAGMPGTRLDANTEALIRDYGLGGIILFKRNIENPIQLASLCRDLQDRAIEYHNLPLFIAIDQEGGSVARLEAPFSTFPGNAAIGNDSDAVRKAEPKGRRENRPAFAASPAQLGDVVRRGRRGQRIE